MIRFPLNDAVILNEPSLDNENGGELKHKFTAHAEAKSAVTIFLSAAAKGAYHQYQ